MGGTHMPIHTLTCNEGIHCSFLVLTKCTGIHVRKIPTHKIKMNPSLLPFKSLVLTCADYQCVLAGLSEKDVFPVCS